MTPSVAYEDANRRDAGHDEMQADLADFLRAKNGRRFSRKTNSNEATFEYYGVHVELMLCVRGALAGFVDVAHELRRVETPADKLFLSQTIWKLFEIKPRIGSVGGLIRQMTATAHIARLALAGQRTASFDIDCIPVVPFDDPALPLLRRMWRGYVMQWDIKTKKPHDFVEAE